ncbi:hypothetical protein SLEP1_g29007 [Rubroshorea leprosula]|uniref:Glycosyltransferase N-terminal domain-containing protein n=1 Tax=Rubroshorea leprosula TaxID=152421 RepID=A0AAV5JY23_9ROSI|nr:hypothetical protein SLEP1_g29007 [Rubroshorea leprosula]
MSSVETIKPHAVCVPFPAQGHVTPLMQLAKLLHYRGFHITFVNTEFNHRRFIRSRGTDAVHGLPDFCFETIPDGLPPSDRDATQDVPPLCDSTRKNCLVPFLELLGKLNSQVPPVTCVVSDGITGFGVRAAEALGIPAVQLWTASACGFMGYLQYSELSKRGIVPFEDESYLIDGSLETPLDWVPGMSNMRLRDIPSFIRTTDPNDIMFDFLGSEAQNCLKSQVIAFNTFDELEHEVLEAIAPKSPPVYTIGPLSLLSRHLPKTKFKSLSSSLWKEDFDCIKWLNGKAENSVVYVNYGSITVMSEEHLKEFAWGLANSKYAFLWILRSDVVTGLDSAILPEEFYDEIKDRGMITSWCPQDQVLCHPAVGIFLTHCGWNSTVESICAGVPVICWPFFAEQQTNCRYACTTWDIGVEVDRDVKRSNIEVLLKEMMEGDEGKRKREKALEWKKKAKAATDVGGSSYQNFDRFIKEVLLQEK